MRISKTKLGLLSTILAFGCTTTSGGAGTGTSAPLTIDTLTPAFVSAYCKSASSCPTSYLWFASPDSCATLFGAKLSSMEEPALVKAGRLTFNADKAAECLAAISGGSCALEKGGPQACRDAFVGVVATGASCEDDRVCVSHWCKGVNQKSATNTSGCGVCTEAIKVGEACTGTGCAVGSKCIGDKCVADGSVAVGAECAGESSCGASAFCDYDGSKQKCVAFAASGEACKSSSACAGGLMCLAKAMTDKSGTCGAARKLGDACFAMGKPGQSGGDCGPGLACGIIGDPDGKSVPKLNCVAQKKMGEACTSYWECGMLDAVCISSKCAAWPAIGQPCAKVVFSFSCGQNAMCNKDGNCAALPKIGEACTDLCAQGLSCKFTPGANDGKCAAQPAAGDVCTQDMDCHYSGLSCGADKKCAAMVCK